jgi:hypothetical protein
MTEPRSIVQIAPLHETLAALCDDGTVWFLSVGFMEDSETGKWVKLPDIPQPTRAAAKADRK